MDSDEIAVELADCEERFSRLMNRVIAAIARLEARMTAVEERVKALEEKFTPGIRAHDPETFAQLTERVRNVEYRFDYAVTRLQMTTSMRLHP